MKKLILKYCLALVNLYGIVSIERVVNTYNMQNMADVSASELEGIVNANREYLRENMVMVQNDDLVAMEIIILGDYDREKGYKGDKPYYIPEREELLRYVNYTYFERTKPYINLVGFLYDLYKDRYKAEELANDIRIYCKSVEGRKNLSFLFEENDFMIKNKKDADELMELIEDLADNTRMWANNGFTPNEIEERN
ncbi:MAG: hypothetical protein NUK57_04480 [Gudongella sp.]|nr:hypothetical protein [Gudongella sp.]